jgi:FtsZ-interacting cell division protein ZipA
MKIYIGVFHYRPQQILRMGGHKREGEDDYNEHSGKKQKASSTSTKKSNAMKNQPTISSFFAKKPQPTQPTPSPTPTPFSPMSPSTNINQTTTRPMPHTNPASSPIFARVDDTRSSEKKSLSLDKDEELSDSEIRSRSKPRRIIMHEDSDSEEATLQVPLKGKLLKRLDIYIFSWQS